MNRLEASAETINSVTYGAPAPGDGRAICSVIAETWLATFDRPEFGITKAMIRGYQLNSEGQLRQDFIEKTEGAISRNGIDTVAIVARNEDRLVGVGSIKYLDQNVRKISALYMLPDFQGHKHGPNILDKLIKINGDNSLFLNVAIFNRRAIQLYLSRDFIIEGPVDESEQTVFNNGMIMPDLKMIRKISKR